MQEKEKAWGVRGGEQEERGQGRRVMVEVGERERERRGGGGRERIHISERKE